ncbi:hypothetical protein, partial [Huaxiibacter chinensis]|uniref:hypothetical protein n=1 Tax=Huaxiibacter chinensis TaxID=2899785 RepID=UPI003D318D0D
PADNRNSLPQSVTKDSARHYSDTLRRVTITQRLTVCITFAQSDNGQTLNAPRFSATLDSV